ncbi:MAG TPA: transglutaminase-like domain-containing protein [Paludibacter sp.]
MNKIKITLGLLLLSILGFASNDRLELKISNIPDSLKKNAYAVVRFSNTEFDYKSETNGLERTEISISILNKKGSEFSAFRCPCDKFRELKSFTGKLFDAEGRLLRKFKMSDVSSTEYSQQLATDAKLYYFDCDLPTYPVTITYEYEVAWKNGILVFPAFYPQYAHNISVEKASYKLFLPDNMEYRSKAVNITPNPQKTTLKGITCYEWEVKTLNAIESENFDPDLDTFVPLLYLSPSKFVYDGVPGVITNWNSMGKWEHGLLNGRDILSDNTKNQIIEMTKNVSSDREKVQIIYDYLGKTTRYVSIQLGIGGYQPMPAAEVCKTGFGDCKALSNYMKSMLSAIGIPSYYTGIRMDKKDKTLYGDYANFNQMNHVILQVPLHKDTLWLECTNPRVPFGFIHNGISGHDALVDYEQGGKIVKLPDYPDSLNIEKNCTNVILNEDGSATVNMNKKCQLKIYDNYDWFPLAKSNEQADNLREDIKLPSVSMGAIQVKENKSAFPNLNIDYTWSTPLYGTKTGNRLFVPVNPYRDMYEGLKKTKRIHDISISAGYKDIDSISITIPTGYEIESMPASTKIKTLFGNFESILHANSQKIYIRHSLFIPSGEYNVSAYPDFVSFFEKISSNYKSKIILRKRTT